MKKSEVIVVGTSPSVLGSNLGDIIDSYETVIRVNMCNNPSLHNDIGEKTNIWATSVYERAQSKFNQTREETLGFTPPEIINKEIWYRHEASLTFFNKYKKEKGEKYKTTLLPRKSIATAVTGILAIDYAVEIYGSIDIVGHSLYLESEGKTVSYNHDTFQEQALIDGRGSQVDLILKHHSNQKLNFLLESEKELYFK